MSKLSTQRPPSPIIDLRKTNNLTIITEEGVEYRAEVVWTDCEVSVDTEAIRQDVEFGDDLYARYLPGPRTTTFQLTAKTHRPVTRVQR